MESSLARKNLNIVEESKNQIFINFLLCTVFIPVKMQSDSSKKF